MEYRQLRLSQKGREYAISNMESWRLAMQALEKKSYILARFVGTSTLAVALVAFCFSSTSFTKLAQPNLTNPLPKCWVSYSYNLGLSRASQTPMARVGGDCARDPQGRLATAALVPCEPNAKTPWWVQCQKQTRASHLEKGTSRSLLSGRGRPRKGAG